MVRKKSETTFSLDKEYNLPVASELAKIIKDGKEDDIKKIAEHFQTLADKAAKELTSEYSDAESIQSRIEGLKTSLIELSGEKNHDKINRETKNLYRRYKESLRKFEKAKEEHRLAGEAVTVRERLQKIKLLRSLLRVKNIDEGERVALGKGVDDLFEIAKDTSTSQDDFNKLFDELKQKASGFETMTLEQRRKGSVVAKKRAEREAEKTPPSKKLEGKIGNNLQLLYVLREHLKGKLGTATRAEDSMLKGRIVRANSLISEFKVADPAMPNESLVKEADELIGNLGLVLSKDELTKLRELARASAVPIDQIHPDADAEPKPAVLDVAVGKEALIQQAKNKVQDFFDGVNAIVKVVERKKHAKDLVIRGAAEGVVGEIKTLRNMRDARQDDGWGFRPHKPEQPGYERYKTLSKKKYSETDFNDQLSICVQALEHLESRVVKDWGINKEEILKTKERLKKEREVPEVATLEDQVPRIRQTEAPQYIVVLRVLLRRDNFGEFKGKEFVEAQIRRFNKLVKGDEAKYSSEFHKGFLIVLQALNNVARKNGDKIRFSDVENIRQRIELRQEDNVEVKIEDYKPAANKLQVEIYLNGLIEYLKSKAKDPKALSLEVSPVIASQLNRLFEEDKGGGVRGWINRKNLSPELEAEKVRLFNSNFQRLMSKIGISFAELDPIIERRKAFNKGKLVSEPEPVLPVDLADPTAITVDSDADIDAVMGDIGMEQDEPDSIVVDETEPVSVTVVPSTATPLNLPTAPSALGHEAGVDDALTEFIRGVEGEQRNIPDRQPEPAEAVLDIPAAVAGEQGPVSPQPPQGDEGFLSTLRERNRRIIDIKENVLLELIKPHKLQEVANEIILGNSDLAEILMKDIFSRDDIDTQLLAEELARHGYAIEQFIQLWRDRLYQGPFTIIREQLEQMRRNWFADSKNSSLVEKAKMHLPYYAKQALYQVAPTLLVVGGVATAVATAGGSLATRATVGAVAGGTGGFLRGIKNKVSSIRNWFGNKAQEAAMERDRREAMVENDKRESSELRDSLLADLSRLDTLREISSMLSQGLRNSSAQERAADLGREATTIKANAELALQQVRDRTGAEGQMERAEALIMKLYDAKETEDIIAEALKKDPTVVLIFKKIDALKNLDIDTLFGRSVGEIKEESKARKVASIIASTLAGGAVGGAIAATPELRAVVGALAGGYLGAKFGHLRDIEARKRMFETEIRTNVDRAEQIIISYEQSENGLTEAEVAELQQMAQNLRTPLTMGMLDKDTLRYRAQNALRRIEAIYLAAYLGDVHLPIVRRIEGVANERVETHSGVENLLMVLNREVENITAAQQDTQARLVRNGGKWRAIAYGIGGALAGLGGTSLLGNYMINRRIAHQNKLVEEYAENYRSGNIVPVKLVSPHQESSYFPDEGKPSLVLGAEHPLFHNFGASRGAGGELILEAGKNGAPKDVGKMLVALIADAKRGEVFGDHSLTNVEGQRLLNAAANLRDGHLFGVDAEGKASFEINGNKLIIKDYNNFVNKVVNPLTQHADRIKVEADGADNVGNKRYWKDVLHSIGADKEQVNVHKIAAIDEVATSTKPKGVEFAAQNPLLESYLDNNFAKRNPVLDPYAVEPTQKPPLLGVEEYMADITKAPSTSGTKSGSLHQATTTVVEAARPKAKPGEILDPYATEIRAKEPVVAGRGGGKTPTVTSLAESAKERVATLKLGKVEITIPESLNKDARDKVADIYTDITTGHFTIAQRAALAENLKRLVDNKADVRSFNVLEEEMQKMEQGDSVSTRPGETLPPKVEAPRPGIGKIDKIFDDGVKMKIDYTMRIAPDGSVLVEADGDIAGFAPEKYMKKGLWENMKSTTADPALARTAAEQDLRNLYIEGRILEGMQKGTREYAALALQLKKDGEIFRETHGDLVARLPGYSNS